MSVISYYMTTITFITIVITYEKGLSSDGAPRGPGFQLQSDYLLCIGKGPPDHQSYYFYLCVYLFSLYVRNRGSTVSESLLHTLFFLSPRLCLVS